VEVVALVEPVQVEIWSDVVCPWCFIGKRRFEAAVAAFPERDAVQVTWKSFQLNPEQPRGARTTHDEHLAAKVGGSIEQVRQLNDRVVALAAAEGLQYDFDHYQVINTFDAHRVAHLGRELGKGAAIQERFLSGQLERGETLDDPDTLVRLSEEVGVPGDEVRDVLATDRYADAVREDIREAGMLGITGVPFFVLDRRYGISGAQPAELFLGALETVRADSEDGSEVPAARD
jgi:predicted DsbA family dithiol-disulfide isomerase